MLGNDYRARVHVDDDLDATHPPLLQALHDKICRSQGIMLHFRGTVPTCVYAYLAVQGYEADREAGHPALQELPR